MHVSFVIMTRQLRIVYKDAWYHVMNRGVNRCSIFLKNEHRLLFLRLLKKITEKYNIEIHSYCLMGNHFHLLVRTPEANLSEALHYLCSVYAREFNISSRRDGPLFKSRFIALLVDSENYLLQVSRYIHLNPVSANMVRAAEDYPWSSYRAYIGSQKPNWLCTDDILFRFEEPEKSTLQKFTNEGNDPELCKFYEKLKNYPVLGNKKFVNKISREHLQDDEMVDCNVSYEKEIKQQLNISFELVEQCVAKYFRPGESDIKERKDMWFNIRRHICIHLYYRLSGKRYADIATEIGNISYSALLKANKRFETKLVKFVKLQVELEVLKQKIKGYCLYC